MNAGVAGVRERRGPAWLPVEPVEVEGLVGRAERIDGVVHPHPSAVEREDPSLADEFEAVRAVEKNVAGA